MKKTKLLTSLAALALVVGLGACEVNVDVGGVDVGGVDVDVDVDSDEPTKPDEDEDDDGGDTGTGGDSSGDTGEGGDTQETPVTYTYSVEVTNADALKELTFDANADSQTGVDLTINLVTTSSAGDVTTDTASADDVTLTPASEGVITVSGLTITPVAAGDTTLTVTWTEGNVSTTADVSVTDATVSTPEPTPTEPTSWSEYLAANADGDHIVDKATIDAFLNGDLDEIIPYVASEIGYQFILISETEGRASFKVSDSDSGPATNAAAAWKTAITSFGYNDLGSSTYQNEAGYKVEFEDWSFIGDFTVYVYPIEQVQEGPTTWSEYLAANAGSTSIDSEDAITALLGASLDEILPYVVPECGYNFITVDATTGCVSFTLDNATYAASTLAEWKSALIAFGYTDLGNLTYQNEAGYKVTLTDWTFLDMIYVYVYPPVDTGDEGGEDLETAQAILNAAAAQTNGYDGFEYLHYDQKDGGGYTNGYYHYMFDLTIDDNNNLYGRYLNHDESGSDERSGIQYFYNKYYYYNNNKSGANAHSAAASLNTQYNSKSGIITGRITGASATYKTAFDNASSIDLANATDLELVTEDNGNYKLTFIYNSTWYCYKADTNLNLVGAGYSTNWTDSENYEIVYGEESTKESLDAIMDVFFADEYWFPKQASDDEIAQAILDAADGADDDGLDWDAFHGEYIDESMDETDTLYLTTNSDGLYGSGICLEDGDPNFEYYYKNGKEYVHNSNNDSYYDGDFYYGETYDDIVDDFTSEALGNAYFVDLDDDTWTLTKTDDSYELIVESTDMVNFSPVATEYVYITDLEYNVLAVAYGVGTTGFDFEGWYAEQATADQVEASLEDFDPANWGEGGGDEATPSWADYMTETSYNTATSTLGATLDEVLPVVLPNGADYAQISASSSRVQLDASYWDYGNCPYDYDALNEAWDEALIADGWTCTFMIEGKTDSVYNTTYATYTKDGYQVEIQYYELYEGAGMWGWDLNLTVIK